MVEKIMFQMFVIIGLVFIGDEVVGTENGYHWPMNTKPALTSTFGEYRSGRFHAGLDLKTWGREGYPVLSVDDGYIWRIRTSPWGYGRALYVKLRDGRTAVYAHLSAFASQLNPFVESEQERRATYSVNLFLRRDQIPIKRGEILGFSGSTGIGAPHLHFELRNRKNHPINPLVGILQVDDTIPPTIRSLAFIPQGLQASVENAKEPYLVNLKWDSNNACYVSSRPFEIEGRIGIACQAYDQADASVYDKVAPYRLRLLVDGKEVFETIYKSFSYDRIYQADLNWNFALFKRGEGRFHSLYREVGNELPIYGDYRVGDGVLHAGVQSKDMGVVMMSGLHHIQVIVEDVVGNQAKADAQVIVNWRPRVLNTQAEFVGDSVLVTSQIFDGDKEKLRIDFEGSKNKGKIWQGLKSGILEHGSGKVNALFPIEPGLLYRVRAIDPQGFEGFQSCSPLRIMEGLQVKTILKCQPIFYSDFAVIHIKADRVLAEPPKVLIRDREWSEEIMDVRQKTLLTYETVVEFQTETSREMFVAISAVGLKGEWDRKLLTLNQQFVQLTGGTVSSEDGRALANFESEDVYQAFFADVWDEPSSSTDELTSVGLAYQFLPHNVPFKGPVELVLFYPKGFKLFEKLGVYERNFDGRWKFLGNDLDPKLGAVCAEVRNFSTYGLFLDTTPPEVKNLRPISGTETTDLHPLLFANLRDVGSGIGREEDIVFRLNGSPVIFEFDPEKGTISARPKKGLKIGEYWLEVKVQDMNGNETMKASHFRVY